jgi:hypothetical protein
MNWPDMGSRYAERVTDVDPLQPTDEYPMRRAWLLFEWDEKGWGLDCGSLRTGTYRARIPWWRRLFGRREN